MIVRLAGDRAIGTYAPSVVFLIKARIRDIGAHILYHGSSLFEYLNLELRSGFRESRFSAVPQT